MTAIIFTAYATLGLWAGAKAVHTMRDEAPLSTGVIVAMVLIDVLDQFHQLQQAFSGG